MKKIIVLCILSVLLAACGPTQFAANSTYYVALNGNNNNAGTAASPWRNINISMTKLHPGDTLCIGTGIWSSFEDRIDSQVLMSFPSGTDYGAGVITVGGCNGDKPMIKPPNQQAAIKLTSFSPHYIVFQDIILDGSNQADVLNNEAMLYVSNGSHHLRFQRLLIQHTMVSAAMFSTNNAPIDFVTNLEIIDSVFFDVGNATGDSGHGGPGLNAGYGMYDTSRGNLYLRNKWYEQRAFALNIYGSDHVVVGNEFYHTATRGGGGAGLNFGSNAHPINSENNIAVNNSFHNNTGNGMAMYTNSTSFAYNNTFYKNAVTALHIQFCITADFHNNLFQSNGADWVNFSPGQCTVTESNNLLSNVDAKLVNPDQGDIHLKDDTSPAYNKGMFIDAVKSDYYNVTRPQAGIFDIGASELLINNPMPPPTESNTFFTVLNTSPRIIGEKGTLKNMICFNPTGDRATIQLYDKDESIQAFQINSTQNLPLVGLNIGYEQLSASSTVLVNCNFTLTPAPVRR